MPTRWEFLEQMKTRRERARNRGRDDLVEGYNNLIHQIENLIEEDD